MSRQNQALTPLCRWRQMSPMDTLARTTTFDVPATPEQVFPLLCPVREREWVPGWSAEVLHSVSGVAEEDCVFRTDLGDAGPMTWVVSRYEPPRRIGFTCFVADRYVMRLEIDLEAQGAATRLAWRRRWLSLGPAGDAWLGSQSSQAYDERMQGLSDDLREFLTRS